MKKILIANRGEIARRVIRTAHAMGIQTVAVYSDPDAGALHVREATTACALGGQTSAESYLRVDKLLQAARDSGADAVHPGYGFLSENADFAEAVQQAGLTWIGPPPAAIRALGDKAGAKALARQAGVPCLPGYDGDAQDEALLAAQAQQVGYPVMVKAVAGGGGRGMRLVADAKDFAAALASARSEAQAAFGSDRVLLERALLAPRHVEVQVFADAHGRCIHLGERDCSVQRRNQKIIEEAPSPAVDAALRNHMGACAVQLAQAAGYVGAGTVEFLVQDGAFYLMEMNTRLQVEHPVTEAITGLDLVEWQIRVARGEPLPLAQDQVQFSGHAIEVRLCAEDEQFTPCTGVIQHWHAPPHVSFANAPAALGNADPVLRIDHAIAQGLTVSPYYDSMLGKLIVHADSRDAAIDALILALRQTQVLGLPTNRAFLAACLDTEAFRQGQALVPFLQTAAAPLRQQLAVSEAAALLPAALATQLPASPPDATPDGALPCTLERPLRMAHRSQAHDWGMALQPGRRIQVRARSADASTPQPPTQWQWQPAMHAHERLRLHCGGQELAVSAVRTASDEWHVQTSAGDELWLRDRSMAGADSDAGAAGAAELRAPFNGRVIRIGAGAGDALGPDDAAIVIDSMKLEHVLSASGAVIVVEVLVEAEQQVTRGQLLMRFAPAEP